MKTVDIHELESRISGCIQDVRDGEEILIRDRDVPIARIVPFQQSLRLEQEARLVASGAMKMPEVVKIDWVAFFKTPAGNVSDEVARQAAIDGRGDR